MDGAGPQRSPADRADIEAAARDMGIVPGDPSYPFVQLMLNRHDQHALEHREHEGRIARLLDRAEAKPADAPRQPLTRNEMVTIADAMDTVLLHRFTRLNRWALGIAAGAGLLVGALAFGAGWFAHANSGQPPVREVTSCVPAPQAAGGEAYTCTFWARMPTGGQR